MSDVEQDIWIMNMAVSRICVEMCTITDSDSDSDSDPVIMASV